MPRLFGISFIFSLLALSPGVVWSTSARRSRLLAVNADFNLEVSSKLMLGKYTTATLTIKPHQDIPHLRLILTSGWIEILGGVNTGHYSSRKTLLKDGSLKAGRPKKFKITFRIPVAPDPKDGAGFLLQPYEFSQSSGWMKRDYESYGGWVLLDENTGEMGTIIDLLHRGYTTPVKDSLNWELSNVFLGKLEGLVQLFTKDEPALTHNQALYLVDKSYHMVLESMNDKNSPFINPNKAEELNVPVERAVKAVQADVAKQVKVTGKTKLDVYRDVIAQWKVERSLPKAQIKN